MNKNNTKTIGEKCLASYPNRIPIIVHYDKSSSIGRFLVPNDSTIGHLLVTIRRNAKINYTDNLFAYVNNNFVPTSEMVSLLYSNNTNASDKCLHITVSKGNTFGN